MAMDGYFQYFLEHYIHDMPEPPPRTRTKPMQVLCVGFPRSGTESLQQALLMLGYDHTYHGWDNNLERPSRNQGWVRLARKKWCNGDSECHVSAIEFDQVMGHAVAVTDAPAACFAPELIQAYPDAKVVLNLRRDLDAWQRSVVKNIAQACLESWVVWLLSRFNTEMFWVYTLYAQYLWPRLFRCVGLSSSAEITSNAKSIYREHSNMIKGLVPKDLLLEWEVEDGWEPLCGFLDKPVPKDRPFPRANDSKAFQDRLDECLKDWALGAIRNIVIIATLLVALGALAWKTLIPYVLSTSLFV